MNSRHSRPPLDRILKIHERLQARAYPNCVSLAAEMEFSALTLKRDIMFMKERLKLPLEYDGRRHGYYYARPVDRFPETALSEAELFSLRVAEKAISQYRVTSFQRPFRMACRKLSGPSNEREPGPADLAALSFRPLAPEAADQHSFEIVTRALREGRGLRFCYRNLGAGMAQKRHVHPYHLACIENHWYLFAHDVKRQAIRTFALARLSSPSVSDERFAPAVDFNPDEYLRGSFTVMRGGDDYEVALQFDRWAADLLRGRQWHTSQRFLELPGGAAVLQMRLNGLEEVERWVLGWGAHATVLRPKALLERIRKTAAELVERYRAVDIEG